MTISVDSPLRFKVLVSAVRHFRVSALSLPYFPFVYHFPEMDTLNRSLCVFVVLLLVYAALAAPAPDPSAKGWGNPIDPDRDCKIRRDGSALNVEMPGIDHDYDPFRKRTNAPRILREIDGEFDLRVRVRIDCCRSAQSTVKGQPSCVSAGFLMIFPDADDTCCSVFCMRLDFGILQQKVGTQDFPVEPLLANPQIENASRKGIGEDGCVLWKDWGFEVKVSETHEKTIDRERMKQGRPLILDRGWRDWPIPKEANCLYLRMKQGEKRITFFMSPDGEKWTKLISCAPTLPAKSKVGLAAYTTSTQPSKVRFDRLKFTPSTKQER